MKVEIKPIRSARDHTAALKQIEALWDAKAGTPAADRLEVLATLVHAYEDQHFPMDPPDPIDAIRFRLEQLQLTTKALEPLIGSRGRVTEVMNRKRNLSIDMIRRISEKLEIPATILIRPTRCEGRPRTASRHASAAAAMLRKAHGSPFRAKSSSRSSK